MLYFKRTLYVLSMIVVVGMVFYLYLPQQTGIIESMNMTVGPNKLDVLCVGSSHMFNGINPIQLYEEYGIAAYDIAIGSQSPWQSYYWIKEACKSQKPKIIIFDVYMVGAFQNVEEAYKDHKTVENLLRGSLSFDKIVAVMESNADSRLNIILRFPYIYDELKSYTGFTTKKLIGLESYNFGYQYRDGIGPYTDVLDVTGVKGIAPLHPKNEKYLRRIISFCKENDIILILTNTPCPSMTEGKEQCFNMIEEIASEKGVPFLNGWLYNEELGIDYLTDCYDEGHLNYSGVTKWTSWVGAYMEQNYDLPDRRGDKAYECYEKGVEYLKGLVAED